MNVDCSDRSLVLRAQSGERGAFNALVRKYRRRVMQLSMRYTRDRDDAEDAVQDAFLDAYGGLRHFRGEASFYSWLHRIVVNSAKTVLSLRAREARLFRSGTGDDDDADEKWQCTDLDTPEELALTEEIRDAISSAMQGLCEEQRTAIALRELQGMSYSQVASAMSCPIGTVRSRVFRARAAIDGQLRRAFDTVDR
ncbi:MAG TPA: sigma-70 family RNA polymerase sigma factor [Steroidobacteraceae bacterium]|nr:sigma-70 family RNA polymerase sigma factor [Steroidobacteraceae bacterium]